MPQSFASLYCHIVFGTKVRAATIAPEIEERLYAYMGGILRGLDCRLLKIGGVEDHVHLLVSLSRERAVSVVLRDLKADSSKRIHDTFPARRRFAWQDGYGAFSVSLSNVDRVSTYIARQKEHHRRVSFRDEVIAMLERHKIPYDVRYLLR